MRQFDVLEQGFQFLSLPAGIRAEVVEITDLLQLNQMTAREFQSAGRDL